MRDHNKSSHTHGDRDAWGGGIFRDNYAEVGRRVSRSDSTVAKYIKLNGTPKIVAHTFKEVVRET